MQGCQFYIGSNKHSLTLLITSEFTQKYAEGPSPYAYNSYSYADYVASAPNNLSYTTTKVPQMKSLDSHLLLWREGNRQQTYFYSLELSLILLQNAHIHTCSLCLKYICKKNKNMNNQSIMHNTTK